MEPTRCWESSDPLYNALPRRGVGAAGVDERGLYERLCLEGFQSGLSWLTILRKREASARRSPISTPRRVARFGERDVKRLLADAGIVRHRGKIEATIANARATLALREAGQRAARSSSGRTARSPAPHLVRLRTGARRPRNPWSSRRSCAGRASASSARRRCMRRCRRAGSSTTIWHVPCARARRARLAAARPPV